MKIRKKENCFEESLLKKDSIVVGERQSSLEDYLKEEAAKVDPKKDALILSRLPDLQFFAKMESDSRFS